jgi:mono/diheme cytochrome c family protein
VRRNAVWMTGCLVLGASAALARALPRVLPQAQQAQQSTPAPATQTDGQASQPDTKPTDVSPAQTGAELFVSSGCQHCHAIDGVGGHKGPDLSGIGRRWKNDAIKQRIEQGTMVMPAYADVLGPGDLDKLVAYLHTRRSRESKTPKAAPVSVPNEAKPDPA